MQKITTFLTYDNQAEDAMNFYTSVFKNSKIKSVMRNGNMFFGGTLEIGGQEFFLLNGGPTFTFSLGISLFVSCPTQEEIDYYWEKLSEGGRKDRCGWLQDKFGVSWQIVPPILGVLLGDEDAAKSQRVMQAMLKMDKLDINGLKGAANQN
ncbi:MAG: VOC family protein [Bacteroidota bacterium]|nr:VOC family protein [Bacteroidota bacterium]